LPEELLLEDREGNIKKPGKAKKRGKKVGAK